MIFIDNIALQHFIAKYILNKIPERLGMNYMDVSVKDINSICTAATKSRQILTRGAPFYFIHSWTSMAAN